MLACISATKLKEKVFDLPAFDTPGNGGISSRGETMNLPKFNSRLAIQYWGGWEVVDAATGKPLPLGGAFFHHITAFRAHASGEREFLTGCSDDRTTLGPDLRGNHFQLIETPDNLDVSGFYHVVNLMPRQVKIAVRYTIRYYADDDIPDDAIFVKAHFLSTAYNVPGRGGFGSVHSFITEVQAPATGYIVSSVGHLHQGALNVTLFDKKTQKPFASSRAIYSEPEEHDNCFYSEWCAQSGTPFMTRRVKALELTNGLHIKIQAGTPWQMISYYDNGAEYRTVMAWVVLFVQENVE
jgi:hypothetical protein